MTEVNETTLESDSKQYIPVHAIVEWLSRRKTFHVQEFKERFYPNETSQAPYTRLSRLKRDKFIAKSMNTQKGMWESLVKPDDIEETQPSRTIPVGNGLPNPLATPKEFDISSLRSVLKEELYNFGDEFIPGIMELVDRPEIAPQKAAKNTGNSGKKCYHEDSDPEAMKAYREVEERFKSAIEGNPQYNVRNWTVDKALNLESSTIGMEILWSVFRRNDDNPEALREASNILYQISDYLGRKAKRIENESKTE